MKDYNELVVVLKPTCLVKDMGDGGELKGMPSSSALTE